MISGETEELTWTVSLYREHPLKTGIVSIFILLFWISVHIVFQEAVFTLLAVFFILISVAPYFSRTTYRFNTEGVTVKTRFRTVHRGWNEFRRCVFTTNGLCLSPFTKPSRLEAFRGLFLIVPEELKNRAAATAEDFIERERTS